MRLVMARNCAAWPLDSGERADAAFERGHALLEHVRGGVHDARVDVAELLEGEQIGGVRGILEDVRSGLVNGNGAGAGWPYRACVRRAGSGWRSPFGGREFWSLAYAIRILKAGGRSRRAPPRARRRAGSVGRDAIPLPVVDRRLPSGRAIWETFTGRFPIGRRLPEGRPTPQLPAGGSARKAGKGRLPAATLCEAQCKVGSPNPSPDRGRARPVPATSAIRSSTSADRANRCKRPESARGISSAGISFPRSQNVPPDSHDGKTTAPIASQEGVPRRSRAQPVPSDETPRDGRDGKPQSRAAAARTRRLWPRSLSDWRRAWRSPGVVQQGYVPINRRKPVRPLAPTRVPFAHRKICGIDSRCAIGGPCPHRPRSTVSPSGPLPAPDGRRCAHESSTGRRAGAEFRGEETA